LAGEFTIRARRAGAMCNSWAKTCRLAGKS
jgi:hypothetical protein